MNPIFNIIRQSLGSHLETSDLNTPVDQLGIDSIDFFDLRVNLDNHSGHEIADSDWLSFTTLQQILDFYAKSNGGLQNGATATGAAEDLNHRRYQINMPQMALKALSENWLLKEMGDFHWNVLCNGLGVDSSKIKDEFGNRLYATFVRIRLVASEQLKAFKENEYLSMEPEMSRYGNSMYFSNLHIAGDGGKKITANLMTTFSYRNAEDNKSLKKGQPFGVTNTIENQTAYPEFGQGYRFLRKKELEQVELLGTTFRVSDEILYETPYEINPYLDLNGVNLLYFAAYPTINDVCEARYFNENHPGRIQEHWAKEAYTLARDIYYLSNCDLRDSIRYRVHEVEFLGDKRVKIQSTLQRESDGNLLARIFTIKEIVA
ncbi:MAG: hypothetical protein KDC44_09270 [Phaeodactylibacter sp.]|nr:hypothetical protein [Phaeodactylibacter sp.]